MDTRTDQLRVRLRREERMQLEKVVSKRPNATISTVIRESLQWALSPNPDQEPVHVDKETMDRANAIAAKLRRDPAQVIKDALIAVERAADNKPMLIVEELKLQTQYAQ